MACRTKASGRLRGVAAATVNPVQDKISRFS